MHRGLFAQYYNWQEFTFPQEELQEGPSAFCDPSYVSHGDKKKPSDPAKGTKLSTSRLIYFQAGSRTCRIKTPEVVLAG
jgi:hypothetical protein